MAAPLRWRRVSSNRIHQKAERLVAALGEDAVGWTAERYVDLIHQGRFKEGWEMKKIHRAVLALLAERSAAASER